MQNDIGFVLYETDISDGVIEMITKSLLDTKGGSCGSRSSALTDVPQRN